MTKKKKRNGKIGALVSLFCVCILFQAQSQIILPRVFLTDRKNSYPSQASIGSHTVPIEGALLDLKESEVDDMDGANSTKGMLLPRVSLTDRNNLKPMFTGSEPDYETLKLKHAGLVVYNVNKNSAFEKGLHSWDGTQWNQVITASPWSLTGNAGATNHNFIGTTDNAPLIFKVNNSTMGYTGYPDLNNVSLGYMALYFNGGNYNAAIGPQALTYNQSGNWNVGMGLWAFDFSNTGSNNIIMGFTTSSDQNGAVNNVIAIGSEALRYNQKDGIVAVGSKTAHLNSVGMANTAIGFESLRGNISGNQNTGLGHYALLYNASGNGANNTGAGFESLIENTDGDNNTAVGSKALHQNRTGSNNTVLGMQSMNYNLNGSWNTAMGASGVLISNTTGNLNTGGGNSALWFNKTGNENTALGQEVLAGNMNGHYNTAIGCRALWSTDNSLIGVDLELGHFGRGSSNTAIGWETLRDLVDGHSNIGIGFHSLCFNGHGSYNVGVGSYTLVFNTNGVGNTAFGIGYYYSSLNGNSNTMIGYHSVMGADGLTNATAIGYGAKADESNKIVIGNNDVTRIEGNVSFTTISDGRIKKNINQDVPGFEFVNLLQPVTYNMDYGTTGNMRKYTGFIAQDVEKAAQSIRYDFSGVNRPRSIQDLYGLSYSDFIVPLVKVVQELNEQNKTKDIAIASLQNKVDELEEINDEAAIASLQNQVEELTGLVNRLIEKNNY